MAKTDKYTAEEMVQAVFAGRGLVTAVAKILKCDPKTVRRYRKNYKSVETAFDEAKEQMLDLTEGKLYDAIRKGQAWAIKYYLSTQGVSRGYNLQVLLAELMLKLKEGDPEAGMDAYMDSVDKLIKASKK